MTLNTLLSKIVSYLNQIRKSNYNNHFLSFCFEHLFTLFSTEIVS